MDHTMTEYEISALYKIYHDEEYYNICEFGKFVEWYTAKEGRKLQNERLNAENKKQKFFGDPE